MLDAADLRGAVAVVTGAGSGIGAALARRLVAAGAVVAAVDLDEAGLAPLREEGCFVLALDMAAEDAVAAAIDRIEAELGPILLFCSNAGIAIPGGCELPTDQWQRIWDVNLMAHVAVARVLIPRWLERGRGHLLITASAAGLLTQLGSAPYAVTKAAAVSLAEWVTITYGDRGVTASALCPQGVRTKMTEGLDGSVVSVDGWLEPEEVAECVLAGLAEGTFLILPHPNVRDYVRAKGDDRDRWIRGMRRLHARFPDGNI